MPCARRLNAGKRNAAFAIDDRCLPGLHLDRLLGTLAILEGWAPVIHRTDRGDLSLFQLGLRLLERFLNSDIPIAVAFQMLESGVFA